MELTVPSDWEGERLDAFLAEPLGSRTRATRLIEAGAVAVDGAAVRKRHRVREGEVVVVDEALDPVREVAPDEGPPAAFGVALEDEHLLVVDKPAGVVVHPARGNRYGTLAQALAGRAAGGEEDWRAGIVHRLDKDTSGLLVVAKDDATHRALKEQLQEREITREYLALVDGRPPARTGTIDAPIGRDRKVRVKMSTDTDEPREARTHFELERALPSSSLLRVRLDTGRTHQIRVHLQAIGHPVCGDPEYGRAGTFGLTRQFLHATRLRFVHPVTGEEVDVLSPLPADLAAALDRAGG
jgi:23S rRNA pseudouridine1911/1915/1917 synthase